jgi:hypothetical protein
MIIQSLDGKWYKEPAWFGGKFYVVCENDVELQYEGRVLWTTARRVLAPLGIKAKLDSVLPDTKIVIKQRLRTASVFRLRLTSPIPSPQWELGYFDEAPQWEGEVLSWNRSGTRWTPIGETY